MDKEAIHESCASPSCHERQEARAGADVQHAHFLAAERVFDLNGAHDRLLVCSIALLVQDHVKVPARHPGVARPLGPRLCCKVQLPCVLPYPHRHLCALQ